MHYIAAELTIIEVDKVCSQVSRHRRYNYEYCGLVLAYMVIRVGKWSPICLRRVHKTRHEAFHLVTFDIIVSKVCESTETIFSAANRYNTKNGLRNLRIRSTEMTTSDTGIQFQ